jgi:hypothetical protein
MLKGIQIPNMLGEIPLCWVMAQLLISLLPHWSTMNNLSRFPFFANECFPYGTILWCSHKCLISPEENLFKFGYKPDMKPKKKSNDFGHLLRPVIFFWLEISYCCDFFVKKEYFVVTRFFFLKKSLRNTKRESSPHFYS